MSAWVGLALTIATTLLSWCYALVSHLRGLPKPYSWPYYVLAQSAEFPHGDRFGDFSAFADQMPKLHTAHFFSGSSIFNYPPAAAIAFRLISVPRHHAVVFYLVPCLVLAFLGSVFLRNRLVAAGVAKGTVLVYLGLSLLFSYPLVFELHRANLEFVVAVLTATGIWCVRKRNYTPAAIALGLAASLKLFPFILFGLFLPVRRYRAFALAWLVMGLATFAGLCVETPSISLSLAGTKQGMTAFSNVATAALHPNIGYDHGVFALLKVLSGGALAGASSKYLLVAGLTAGVLYFARIWRLPLLNQVLALTLCSVLLPPFSADYTLLHLYCPWALLLLAMVHGFVSRAATLLMGCFGLVFGLQAFLIANDRVFAAQFKCVVMLVMLAVVLLKPMKGLEQGPQEVVA